MSRIVKASARDLVWFNEEFMLWPMKEKSCHEIADTLNTDHESHPDYWFKVVPDDYKLYEGMVP